MFGLSKETLILIAVVLALVTNFYLFNDNKKIKADVSSLRSFLGGKPASPAAPSMVKSKVKTPVVVKRAPEVEADPDQDSEIVTNDDE
jgi:hypothetical protein